jgi:hypothetical protein
MIEGTNQLRVILQQMRRLLWALADLKSKCYPRTRSYSPPWPKRLWQIWSACAGRSRVFLIDACLWLKVSSQRDLLGFVAVLEWPVCS